MSMKPKRKNRPGQGRKPTHPSGTRKCSVRLTPDVLAVIESLDLSIQDGVLQMCRHSPEYRLSGVSSLPPEG